MMSIIKSILRLLALVAVTPSLLSYVVRAQLMGRNRALLGSAQCLSLVPGLWGQYVRRAFLAHVLEGGCADSAVVEFGVLFSQVGARLDEDVYVGPRCHLGLV